MQLTTTQWSQLLTLPFHLSVTDTGGGCRELSGDTGNGHYIAFTDGDGDAPTRADLYAYVARTGESEPMSEHSGWAGLDQWLATSPWQTTGTDRDEDGSASPCERPASSPAAIRARIADLLAEANVFDMDGLEPGDITDDAVALHGAIITMVNHHDLTFTGLPSISCHLTADEEGTTGSMLLCLHLGAGAVAATYIKPKSLCPESPATAQELLIEIAVALLDEATILSKRVRLAA